MADSHVLLSNIPAHYSLFRQSYLPIDKNAGAHNIIIEGFFADIYKKSPVGLWPSGLERGRLPTFPLSQYHRRGKV